MTVEAARALIPAGSHAEMEELLKLDIPAYGLVAVVGAYQGCTAQIIYEAYGCRLLCFEPQPRMCAKLHKRVPTAEIHEFGLGTCDGAFPMWEVGNSGASFHAANGTRTIGVGRMRDVATVLKNLDIDLLFLNCEGSEYEILERMTGADMLKRVRMIMVQFHLAVTSVEEFRLQMDRLKQDYTVVWTTGAPWTLLKRRESA